MAASGRTLHHKIHVTINYKVPLIGRSLPVPGELSPNSPPDEWLRLKEKRKNNNIVNKLIKIIIHKATMRGPRVTLSHRKVALQTNSRKKLARKKIVLIWIRFTCSLSYNTICAPGLITLYKINSS